MNCSPRGCSRGLQRLRLLHGAVVVVVVVVVAAALTGRKWSTWRTASTGFTGFH